MQVVNHDSVHSSIYAYSNHGITIHLSKSEPITLITVNTFTVTAIINLTGPSRYSVSQQSNSEGRTGTVCIHVVSHMNCLCKVKSPIGNTKDTAARSLGKQQQASVAHSRSRRVIGWSPPCPDQRLSRMRRYNQIDIHCTYPLLGQQPVTPH
jgi:hypothetical protein